MSCMWILVQILVAAPARLLVRIMSLWYGEYLTCGGVVAKFRLETGLHTGGFRRRVQFPEAVHNS